MAVRIGISGHMDLTPHTAQLVGDAIEAVLAGYRDLDVVGVTCLAPGADTIFAEAVLRRGGELEVIVPAADYRDRQAQIGNLERFDSLVGAASSVTSQPYQTSGPAAYQAANDALLSGCDRLIAVWDGHGAVDAGSTASVVAEARARELPVDIVWPLGASRSGEVRRAR